MADVTLLEPRIVSAQQSINAVVEMVDNVDQKHDAAHIRLRDDFKQLEERVESNYKYFRERIENISTRTERTLTITEGLQSGPINLDRLLFTPKIVAAIIISLLSIYGFFIAATSGLKSDLSDVKAAMNLQDVRDKARSDMQDVRDKSLQNDINELRKQVQLMNLQNEAAKGKK